MFIGLLISPLISIYHIIIHAIFKSLLFLFSGSIIHIESNYQSIYKLKLNDSINNIIYILCIIILIYSYSKEYIIKSINIISSYYYLYISIIGSLFTIIYIINILRYLYYYIFNNYIFYSSYILPFLSINSIIIDQCFYE